MVLPHFYEGVVEGPDRWDDPARVEVVVELTSPSGKGHSARAFWDGGLIWRFRYAPWETGLWRFKVRPSRSDEGAWRGREGEFVVPPYAGPNPLYRHGPLRVSGDGHYLVHRDGTLFFWLADTAWNGVLKSDHSDWEYYLATRREQGFTVTQVVMTDWRAFFADAQGERAFEGPEAIRINPCFFRRLDQKVAAIARHGIVPCLVVLWALTDRDPGYRLPEREAIHLARYIISRYAAYQAVWFLGGDGRYVGDDVARWKRIGRAVFDGDEERALTTLHPCGTSWIGESFREEPWYDFIGYQSSHGPDRRAFDWIVHGPPAKAWPSEPLSPVINLEPCYESHKQGGTNRRFTAHDVRIAMYHSLLVSPTAGVTYGHAGVWPWNEQEESPLMHLGAGTAPPWHRALTSEGGHSMTCLKRFFDQIQWWKLRPSPDVVGDQPGTEEGRRWVAASTATDASEAVVYVPYGGEVILETNTLQHLGGAEWYNPRTGEQREADAPSGARQLYQTPDEYDWLLYFGARRE